MSYPRTQDITIMVLTSRQQNDIPVHRISVSADESVSYELG